MANLLDQFVELLSSEENFISLLENLRDVVPPEALMLIAQIGNGIGPEVYETVPESMKKAPTDLKEAYAQSYYFTVIAVRRSIRLDEENVVLPSVTQTLLRHFSRLLDESKIVDLGVSKFCDKAGLGCPVQSPKMVLLSTMKAIENSGLPPADVKKINGFLSGNRNKMMMNRAIPWVLGFVAVGLLSTTTTLEGGSYFFRKGSAE